MFFFFFFFQAEDGIRDLTVTGVQTCALPILMSGTVGDFAYAASAGVQLRRDRDLTLWRTGPALAFAAAVAWRRGPFQVGPELYGRHQFQGDTSSPVELLLGGRW